MSKSALLALALTVILCAGFAAAQQVDLTVGGSILSSPSPSVGSQNFQQPSEKGGTYIGVSGDFVGFRGRRVGLNFETAWRHTVGNYPFNGETYRPIFTDVNALFQPRIGKKLGLDLMAGVGIASTRFNLPGTSICSITGGGCVNYTSSNHFMEDLGGGLRYYIWRHFFVRPEIHYYHIQNNVEFHSANVFRAGASIGYTFHSE